MANYDGLYGWRGGEDQVLDAYEKDARDHLRPFFEQHRDRVFFSRQLEVQNEDRYFHWVTNRAIRDLEGERDLSGLKYVGCPGRGLSNFSGIAETGITNERQIE